MLLLKKQVNCNWKLVFGEHLILFDGLGPLGSVIYKCLFCDKKEAVLPDGPGSAMWRAIDGKQDITPKC